MIRLDKYLADMGCGTRSEVKRMIGKGMVLVNGEKIKKPETKVDETADTVCCCGEKVGYCSYEYYMLNKPAGVVSATMDRKDKTVVDLIASRKRKDLFPVGRLDKDTEGLLLITNDGALSHRLLSPGKHVDKTYYAKIDGIVEEQDVLCFEQGIDIGDDKPTIPAKLHILSTDLHSGQSEIELTIQEGRFHQVKRMFESQGKQVRYLKRISMGCLSLDMALAPGEYRALTEEEITKLC